MFWRNFLVISLLIQVSSFTEQHRQRIERVRNYLRQYDTKKNSMTKTMMTTNWLENSNKIGFGYNLLSGSPVCYTGSCQMEGFTRPIFKLNYLSPTQGSCASKLVPDHVDLDCLPSMSLHSGSEIISTVDQLKQSISNKIEISLSANYLVAAFSYSYSKETKYMIDNIVKHDTTSIFTTAEVSYAKLSLFEPLMELSDNFRYVLENMPCCDADDADIIDYIHEFIFNYFGFTYITNLLLGGIAQRNILIDRQTHEQMANKGTNTKHQAEVSFQLDFGASASTVFQTTEEQTTYNSFMSQVQSTKLTTLGGDPHLMTLSDWSKTVSSNPVVIKFTVRDIFRLLTKRYFPTDSLIANKSALVKQTLDKYLNQSTVYCYNDCGGNNGSHGVCIASGHFQFGQCQCKPEWTGSDCSTPVNKTHIILHGTICGFDRSFFRINCEGLQPHTQGCPSGWIQHYWNTDLTVCYKNGALESKPVVGTLCGIFVTYQYPLFQADIKCGNKSVDDTVHGGCPSFYQRASGIKESSSYRNTICVSLNAKQDLSGTICGMQIDGTIDGPTCDGYHPGLRQCPPNYHYVYLMFNAMGFFVCVKD